MSFARKRTIEMDGASVTFSPLSNRQHEELLAAQDGIINHKELPESEKNERLLKLQFKMIADAINRAEPEVKVTPEALKEELDNVQVVRLRREIMVMSGLAEPKEGEPGAP